MIYADSIICMLVLYPTPPPLLLNKICLFCLAHVSTGKLDFVLELLLSHVQWPSLSVSPLHLLAAYWTPNVMPLI